MTPEQKNQAVEQASPEVAKLMVEMWGPDNNVADDSFFDGKDFIPKRLGDRILHNHNFKTLKANDRIYVFADGFYQENGDSVIRTACKNLLGEDYTSHRANETLSYIRACTYIDHTEADTKYLNMANGLLDPMTMEFKPHDPAVFSLVRVPIAYDPTADCPLWKTSLAAKVDEQAMMVLQEMFGYCFLPGQRYEVAFLFHGPKQTMKSTALFILGRILGADNITAFPLQQLNDDSFAAAYLFGKLANICADLDAAGLRSTGRFMQIVGGDKITAGRKHEHHLSFFPSVKLVFSCNVIPATGNKDLAFYRRWIILPFDKTHDKVDPDMRDKLAAELPGIFNWALQGLARLRQNNRFSYWLNAEQVKDIYERASDSVSSYIVNCITCEDDDAVIKKRIVYADYANYCNKNRLHRENPIKFGREFLATTGCGTCKEDGIPAYAGVWMKTTKKDGGGLKDYV